MIDFYVTSQLWLHLEKWLCPKTCRSRRLLRQRDTF